MSDETKQQDQQNADGLWCEVCDKREAHAYLEVTWHMGMGGEDTDAESLACCRRCSGAVLNAWDELVEKLRES